MKIISPLYRLRAFVIASQARSENFKNALPASFCPCYDKRIAVLCALSGVRMENSAVL